MEFYSLEQLHLCRLATVERGKNILILCEDSLRTYLIVSELKNKNSKVLDFNQLKDICYGCERSTRRIFY